MLPWSFSEEAAVAKIYCRSSNTICGWWRLPRLALSVITGGRQVDRDQRPDAGPADQHLIVTAERKFWRCVETGEPPALFGAH